jgi:putative OPT family oligopeptide transporter
MSWFVLVPLFGWVAGFLPATGAIELGNVVVSVSSLTPEVIFRNFVQRIGIGCIAVAGILGIIKSLPVIIKSFSIGFKGFKSAEGADHGPRTDRDMNMMGILFLVLASLVVLTVFFASITSLTYTFIGLAIVLVISFLFTTVAANAIAIVGTNPVSGMTLMTLILSSAILVSAGLSGDSGKFVALIIGGVVCTALSVAGAFVTDLKVGYWLGSSPFQQERWKFTGVFVSAATVGLAIILIDNAFGFLVTDPVTGQPIPNPAMPAPQANLMRAIIETFMDPSAVIPWMLFGIGAIIALMMNWIGVPALAFGLGMYLPQEINTPLLLGAFVAYLLKKSSKNDELANARFQKGTLVASGFIAGAALFKILEAVMRVWPVGSEVVNGIERPISLLDSILRTMGVHDVSAGAGGGFTNSYMFGLAGHDMGTLIGLFFILGLTVWMFFYSKTAKPVSE